MASWRGSIVWGGGKARIFRQREIIPTKFTATSSPNVSVHDFFQHFKGDFRGKTYDSDLPSKSFFPNNRICDKFADFISETIIERVENGSLSIWGREGECEPPHLVLPITVEPKKPRMCHDERFLNLWMNTPKVSFDQITDLPRDVEHGNYQTKLDDKSGYDLSKMTVKHFSVFVGKAGSLSTIHYLLAGPQVPTFTILQVLVRPISFVHKESHYHNT